MNIKNITDKMSFSEQITLADVQQLADNGVELVINNRPDGEEATQPTSAEIEQVVLAAGLKYAYVPIINRDIPAQAITEFTELTSSQMKIHAYCRTGTRSSLVWAMTQASVSKAEDIIAQAKVVNIDLTGIATKLEAINQQQ